MDINPQEMNLSHIEQMMALWHTFKETKAVGPMISVTSEGVHLDAKYMSRLFLWSTSEAVVKPFKVEGSEYAVEIVVKINDVTFFSIFSWNSIYELELWRMLTPELKDAYDAYFVDQPQFIRSEQE